MASDPAMFDLDTFSPMPVESLQSDTDYRQTMTDGSQGLLIALHAARGVRCPPHLLTPAPVPVFRQRPVKRPKFSPYTPLANRTIPMAIRTIINGVAKGFDVTADELLGRNRHKHLVHARSVAVRLIRDRTWENGEPKHSTITIGRFLNRDHSTICHTLWNFEMYRRHVPLVGSVYEALRERGE
jgi:hypothetical protein